MYWQFADIPQKKRPTLKDLDFNARHPNGLIVDPDTHEKLINAISRDVRVGMVWYGWYGLTPIVINRYNLIYYGHAFMISSLNGTFRFSRALRSWITVYWSAFTRQTRTDRPSVCVLKATVDYPSKKKDFGRWLFSNDLVKVIVYRGVVSSLCPSRLFSSL